MHRYRFILLRPFQLIPVLFGISIVTFVLVRLIPGDPARVILAARAARSATPNSRPKADRGPPLGGQGPYFVKNPAGGKMAGAGTKKVLVRS